MFDAYVGEINISTIVILFAVVVCFPLQLWLCFKVKRRLVRLLPVLILAAIIVVLSIMIALSTDWDALGYLILDIFAVFLLIACAVGWLIWGVVQLIRKTKSIDH